jgi:hypothetical protein
MKTFVRVLTVAVLGTGATTGCESLLEVSLPGAVEEQALHDEGMAPILVRSAQNDFECSLVSRIVSHGMWSSQFNNASTNQGHGAARTRRIGAHDTGNSDCSDSQMLGGIESPYGATQIARVQAKNAYEIISGHKAGLADKQKMLATAALYEGFSILGVSEGYCSVRLDAKGAIITTAAAIDQAAARFASARGHAQTAGASDILNAARVGGARALNFNGKNAAAKALAALVPSGFVFNATYDASPPRRHNKVYTDNHENRYISVHPQFHTNVIADPVLKVGGVNDPRVPVEYRVAGGANDGVTPMWLQTKYPANDSEIPLATWQEAQLIVAEAEVAAGNAAAAVTAIDLVRAFYGLPLYATDPGGTVSAAAVKTQLIQERKRQLFVQGHWLGDMIRFGLAFEQGVDPKGQPFIPDVTCIPIRPADEDAS